MEYFAGLDVSLETVNVCVVDEDGNILLERKVDAEPDTIVTVLRSSASPSSGLGLKLVPPPPGCTVSSTRQATRRSASNVGMSRPALAPCATRPTAMTREESQTSFDLAGSDRSSSRAKRRGGCECCSLIASS